MPLELVLARNARAAVALTKFGAYPEGFELEVFVLVAEGEDELDPNTTGHPRGRGRRGRVDMEREMLRFGVQFADGAKATNLPGSGREALFRSDEAPRGPVLMQRGGGGGGGEWRQSFWVWPLPPSGPVTFACEWPAADIPLTKAEIDAQVLIDGAGRAQQMFERSGAGHGGSWRSTVSIHRRTGDE